MLDSPEAALLIVLSSKMNKLKNMNMNYRKIIVKIFACSAVAAALLITAYMGYLWFTYIDETVTFGHAYGFSIGDDKLTAYKKAPEALADLEGHGSTAYIEVKADVVSAKLLAVRPNYTLMVEAILHDVGYPMFKEKNQWNFYINGSYFNMLSLKFCGDSLCEIYRHRKYFELP